MSEEVIASITSVAMMEQAVQKPFIDAGIALPPLPATLLLSMLKRPEEEKEEEEVIEEKKILRARYG